MAKKIDLTGQRFGRYLVLEERGKKYNKPAWFCKCGCGTERIVGGSHLRGGNTKSCGCLRKELVSETMKGNQHALGYIHTEESKQKIRDNHADVSGEKNPSHNPNLTDEERQDTRKYPEYYEWRTAVFERDNHTCQCCGSNIGGDLVAHHLDGYDNFPELRITLDNGITLCEKCHDNFHHQYGYGNNTREQFEEFLRAQKIC